MGYIPKNFPVLPVTPYPGDHVNLPVKGNSGIGVRELAALVILHSLLADPKYDSDRKMAISDAFELADCYYKNIFE
jgi:hypothetical protein